MRPAEEPATRALFAGLVVLPIDADVSSIAGTWRREQAAAGATLWQADCLIGAAAFRQGARLCTGNPKDFPFPELAVDHWPVGE